MTPTETLYHEHDIILLVLDAVDRAVESFKSTGALNLQQVEQMLDFFRNFADTCHHMKEEKQLFPRMAEHGVPFQGGPLGVMMTEHELGRHFLREIAAALPRARTRHEEAPGVIVENLAGYSELLRTHIMKENNIVFPLADRVLSPEDQTYLTQEFDRIESEEMGTGTHEKYHQLAHQLAH